MSTAVRFALTTTLTAALVAGVVTPVYATDDSLLVEGESTSIALPEGGEVDFNVVDQATDGATVEAEPIEVEGATAETADGAVVSLTDGVSIVATDAVGGDVTEFEHQVTVVEETEDTPAYVSEFVPAIELTFPISEEQLSEVDVASLGVYSRESEDDEWTWVPSAYDPELGAVVAQSDHLSEFIVMAAPAAAVPDPTIPRIALDPDDALGRALWNGHVYNELQFSHAVATAVKARLENECLAEVLITRNSSTAFVARTTRSNRIRNFDADIAMTLAFNNYNTASDGIARPWGISRDGGVVAWSASNSASTRLGNNTKTQIVNWTGRPDRRGLNPPSSVLPYSQLVGSAPAYAHAELLFLSHNYDWPIISTRLDLVTDAVYSSIIQQIEATGGIACAEPVTLPTPPTQDVLDDLAQLGENNYQIYGTDPVNLATGNFLASEEVFTLSGVGDQAIDLTLAYNALDGRVSPVGNGWNFGYSSRAQLYDNGAVMAILADGRSVFFESDGAGGFVTPPGARSTLAAVEGGAVLTFADNTSLEFTFDEESGYGTLARAVDRQGNAYTLVYGPLAEAAEGEYTFPPLLSITDQAGQMVAVQSTPEGRITGFTHPDGRQWMLAYDAAGNLTSIMDGAGRTRSFAYNAGGLLEVVTGADGVAELTNVFDTEERVVIQTDGAGYVRTIAYGPNRETTLTDALGNASTLTHNDKNQVVRALDAEGGVTLNGYDEFYNPNTSTDANGNVYTSEFDVYGRVTSSTNAVGETTTYGYNSRGDLVSISSPDPNGGTATTSFVLNEDGRATETHLPDGTVTYASFDAHGDMTSITDATGGVTTMAYDWRGNSVTSTDALGHVTARTYDLANRLTSVTDAKGALTTLAYDAADNLISTLDALGGVATFVYDVNDSLVSETNEAGETATYEYNVNLQLTAANRADGSRMEYAYDAEHRMVAQTNPDGTSRTWEYDGLGRATVMVDEAGERWLTEYDAIGNPVAAIDPSGARNATAFDAMSRPVTFTDALGNSDTVTYLPGGAAGSQTDALGRTSSYSYDAMGRLESVTTPDGETRFYSYDANGRLVSATNARGFTQTYQLDALGREVSMTDALGNLWRTEYDALGNTTATVDALGNRTEIEYDALSRLVATTDALGAHATFTFDAVGRATSETNKNGNAVNYAYDALGRLTRTTYPDGSTASTTYNARGLAVGTVGTRGFATAYEYDARSMQTAMVDEAGERWLSEYDSRGNLVANIDPAGGRTEFDYDALSRRVATTDQVGARTAFTYDAAGQMTSATNALGNTVEYAFDVMGRMVTVTTPDTAAVAYGYDANGNVTSFTNQRGFTETYLLDPLDRMVSRTDTLGGTWATEFDALGNATATVDPLGNRTEATYDALSRIVGLTDALAGATTFTYDAIGARTSTTNALGQTTSLTYDSLGRPVGSTFADGTTASNVYDAGGLKVTSTDQRGNAMSYEYDARGLQVASVDTAGERWLTEYDSRGNVTASVDPLSARSTAQYDAASRPVAVVNAVGSQSTFAYDALGQMITSTNALGDTTAYTYDAMQRMVTMTTPEGATSQYGYDANGNTTSITNALGDVLATEYDAAGRAIATVLPDGGRTETARDALGREVATTDARGNTTAVTYDALGRPTLVLDAAGFATTATYDAGGNRLSTTDARGGTTGFVYDVMNRLVSTTNAEGETRTQAYDTAGNITEAIDPSGIATHFTYDVRNLLTETVENFLPAEPSSESVNVTTSVSYDARGDAVATVDPRGNATTFVRDALGRVETETDALGQTSTVDFDALGRPSVVTAPDGSVTATTFSADGYAVEVAYPDQTVTSGFDALGNRTSMTDDLGTSSWTYDWASRVTVAVDALGQKNTNQYDLAGNQTRVAYDDGRSLLRTYDARNLAVSQSDANGVAAFGYDEVGALVGILRPSGVETEISRDLVGRVTAIVHAGEGVVGNKLPSGEVNPSSMAPGNAFGHCKDNGNGHPNQQPAGCSTGTLAFEYAYDARGLVDERELSTDEASTLTDYTHDELGRLTESVTGDYVASYGWDAASNMVFEAVSEDLSTNKKNDGYTVTRSVNAINQLTSSAMDPAVMPASKTETTAYTYDARGNRTQALTTTTSGKKTHTVSDVAYTYDGRDLVSSVAGGDTDVAYGRDGIGRALEVSEDGTDRTRLYDGLSVVRDGDTQLTRGPGGAVLFEATMVTSGKGKNATTSIQTVDVLADLLGSAVTTASDGVISADLALYGDFGDLLTDTSQDTVTGFTGQVDTAGLLEFASRSYDIGSRVWVQDDRYRGTVTRASSLNRYTYVEGAPETYIDILGFFRAAAALRAQQLAALNAQLQSALGSLGNLYGVAVNHLQGTSAADMLKIYNNLTANLDPAVRAVLAPIASQMATGVGGVHFQQAVYEREAKAYREAHEDYLKALERQDIHLKWEAEQLAIRVENESLVVYNAVTFLRNGAIGVGKVLAGLTPYPMLVENVKCIAGGWSGMQTCSQEARDEARDLAMGLALRAIEHNDVLEDVFSGDASIGDYWDSGYQVYRDYTFGPTLDACRDGQFDKCGQGVGEGVALAGLFFVPGGLAAAGTRVARGVEVAAATARTAQLVRTVEVSRVAEAARIAEAARVASVARPAAAAVPGGAVTTQPAARFIAGSDGVIVDTLAKTALYAPRNLGQMYANGTSKVVQPPFLNITGISHANPKDPFHFLNRAIERGASPSLIVETVRSPRVVLQQSNGKYLYLTDQAAVVLDQSGAVVTVWTRAEFESKILSILNDA